MYSQMKSQVGEGGQTHNTWLFHELWQDSSPSPPSIAMVRIAWWRITFALRPKDTATVSGRTAGSSPTLAASFRLNADVSATESIPQQAGLASTMD